MINPPLWDNPELRSTARKFSEREIMPYIDQWEEEGLIPRELHKKAGELGFLGLSKPESVGGEGGSMIDEVILHEELLAAGMPGGVEASLFTCSISVPHIIASGDEYLIDKYVKPVLSGDAISSLALTEPGAGSDVNHFTTKAVRDGDDYIINGSKIFITSAVRADFVVVCARTGGEGAGGLSLIVVEAGTPGFTVARKLNKMGWLSSDTAELSFVDCRVPAKNLIGPENGAFALISGAFVSERIGLAVLAYGSAQRALDLTVQWCRDRETFGRPLIKRQHVQMKLTEMQRKVDVARVYTRALVERAQAGEGQALIADVCFAKNTAVENGAWVVDKAVQLHGGMGYMRETEVERIYRDFRIIGIGGGTDEIMTMLAGKLLGYS